jgi:hypothetical protein
VTRATLRPTPPPLPHRVCSACGRPDPEPPLRAIEAARMLNVSYRTILDLIGLEWIEYETIGSKRPIRRIVPESVRRLLAKRRGQS